LSEEGYSKRKIGYVNKKDKLKEKQRLVKAILAYPGNLYIKSARTGGGFMVVRVRKEGDETIIESDAPSFEEFKAKRVARHEKRMESLERLTEMGMSGRAVGKIKATYEKSNPANPERMLYELFYVGIRNPIIEEEMPYATVDGKRAELRFICQRVSDEFEVFGYAKVSKNPVSANISLGGAGDEISYVLQQIYLNNIPEMSDDSDESYEAALDKATEEEAELTEKAKSFAEQLYSHYAAQKGEEHAPLDFAIDIVPAWNSEKGEMDYYFLEINYSYGFRGLIKANPYHADRVFQNKAKLGTSPDT
jgi:hypothetical protein